VLVVNTTINLQIAAFHVFLLAQLAKVQPNVLGAIPDSHISRQIILA